VVVLFVLNFTVPIFALNSTEELLSVGLVVQNDSESSSVVNGLSLAVKIDILSRSSRVTVAVF